jgi:hypothetical protein
MASPSVTGNAAQLARGDVAAAFRSAFDALDEGRIRPETFRARAGELGLVETVEAARAIASVPLRFAAVHRA